MTAFTDLLADFESEKHFLVHLEPYDPGAAAVVNLYYSSHGFVSAPADVPANTNYDARVEAALSFQRNLFSQGRLSGRSIPGNGKIVLNNKDGGLDILATYAWGGRRVRVWLGGREFSLSGFGLIFDGTCGPIEYGDGEILIPLRDLQHKLDKELQTTLFLGTGGAEGGTDVKSRKKPKPYGPCRNVTPVFVGIASGRHQYVCADGAIVGVLRVLDGAVALAFTASATPAAGEWTVDVASGLVTLGAAPSGAVTCDVIGRRYLSAASATSWTVATGSMAFAVAAGLALAVGMKVRIARTSALASVWGDGAVTAYAGTTLTINVSAISGAAGPFTDWTIMPWGTVAGIVKAIAAELGITAIDEPSFTALDSAQPATIGWWIPDGGNGLNILDAIADGAGCYYGFTRSGSFQAGRLSAAGTSVESYDGTQILSLVRNQTEEPRYRVIVRHRKCHTALSLDQVLGAATDADRLFVSNEWRQALSEDTAVLAAYPLSQAIEVDSPFDETADAAAEAARLLALWKVRRDYFTGVLKVQPLARELAETVTIMHDRYALAGGDTFVIVDLTEDLSKYEVTLGLWG